MNWNMKGSVIGRCLLGAMPLIFGVTANAASISTSPVLSFSDDDQHGSSIIVRNPGGVTASLSAYSGVPSGEAVTMWFIVFNNPESCISYTMEEPGITFCGEEDVLENPNPANVAVLYGTGHIVGNGAQVHLSGSLQEGDNTGAETFGGFYPSDNLEDAEVAEIHLIVRGHGPANHGRGVRNQIRTGQFECEPPICEDILFSVHNP
jgi:hypothetical protein